MIWSTGQASSGPHWPQDQFNMPRGVKPEEASWGKLLIIWRVLVKDPKACCDLAALLRTYRASVPDRD